MLKKSLLFFVILPVMVLNSCALKPISSEYKFVEKEEKLIKLDQLGDGKILIYNGADILHRIDNTGRLNILIDDKALGQVRPAEYVIINLDRGMYKFNVLHIDVFKMKSKHEVKIDENTKIIRIEPTITSNKLTITNEFPKKFEKFKYVIAR